ncbi:unnamed protein product [Blepharisma stoltei]|uniref:Uncharacterized protein n=1 Tax=Blepharisma stoltei TaxID=1481888 RepID=A0AAU9KFV6_9CILI|nr:unnamed protein product [Blepharisma stoltei]
MIKKATLLGLAGVSIFFVFLCHSLRNSEKNDNISYISNLSTVGNAKVKKINCKRFQCPWLKYLPNDRWIENYQNKTALKYYDDVELKFGSAEKNLYCLPQSFGYDENEAKIVFPLKNYPKCREKYPNLKESMFMNIKENTLTMNCTGNFMGKYVLGMNSYNESFILESAFNNPIRLYNGPVTLKNNEEWALGTCEPDGEYFDQIQYKFRYKMETKERVFSKMLENHKSSSSIEAPKKLIILLISIDSASRRHFYRKLPNTVNLLNSLNDEEYKVYDFKIHNVIGDNSVRNVIPLFTGSSRIYHVGDKEDEWNMNKFYHGDALGNSSIFWYMKERGFATLLGFEFCSHYFANYMGDKPDIDHIMGNFWCGAQKHCGYSYEKIAIGQRCLGTNMSHKYMFDYLSEFTSQYNELNQFIYLHVTANHEASGTLIETLDDDLSSFLLNYFSIIKETGHELALFLHGDHGMRYGEWYRNPAAFQEHRLPALFLIASDSILKRLQYSYDILLHNSKRLVGKLDLYLTLKHLSNLPYSSDISQYSSLYKDWKAETQDSSISLLLEKVPNNRGCIDIGISNFWCSCMNMDIIEKNVINSDFSLKFLIEKLSDYMIELINEEAYLNFKTYKNSICKKVTLKEVISVYAQKIKTTTDAYKLEFSINEDKNAVFEAYIVIGKKRGCKENTGGFHAIPIYYKNRKLRAVAMFLKRIDKNEERCEHAAKEIGVNPDFCICRD